MGNDPSKSPNARGADLAHGLGDLDVGRKSRRLYAMWPAIEERLAQGISHAQVLEFLNGQGFALTERTYKTYVYRIRKRLREQAPVVNPLRVYSPARAIGAVPLPTLSKRGGAEARYVAIDRVSAVQDTSPPGTGGRPASFDFDPTGISPHLLK